MPEFCNSFYGNKCDRKLSDAELIRSIRLMVAAEYEAIQLYMQLVESTDNELAKAVLTDVADEEREHAGEFLRLLHELAPDEQRHYDHGKGEVEEMIAKLKKVKAPKAKAAAKAKPKEKTEKVPAPKAQAPAKVKAKVQAPAAKAKAPARAKAPAAKAKAAVKPKAPAAKVKAPAKAKVAKKK